MRKFLIAVPIAVLAIGGSTACATKKLVRTSVGEVNDKVDSRGKSVEETQERTRRNEGRISEDDQKAQAVRRYLYEQYQIPLHKMSIISYGEEKPIAPNKTKAGRAQNRRVVIKVLA